MSKPATHNEVITLFVGVVIISLVYFALTLSYIGAQEKQTRRCIVESRNSVEVPEVCK